MSDWQHASVPVTAEVLRAQFRHLPSPVVAVCAIVDGDPVGMVMSSFTSVSLDPPLASFCPARTSRTWESLRTSPALGISLLTMDQTEACRALASRGPDRFRDVEWDSTDSGAVFVTGSALQLEAEVEAVLPGGDHHVVLVRLLNGALNSHDAPMIFHRGGYVAPEAASPPGADRAERTGRSGASGLRGQHLTGAGRTAVAL